jgi:hypothetical protein
MTINLVRKHLEYDPCDLDSMRSGENVYPLILDGDILLVTPDAENCFKIKLEDSFDKACYVQGNPNLVFLAREWVESIERGNYNGTSVHLAIFSIAENQIIAEEWYGDVGLHDITSSGPENVTVIFRARREFITHFNLEFRESRDVDIEASIHGELISLVAAGGVAATLRADGKLLLIDLVTGKTIQSVGVRSSGVPVVDSSGGLAFVSKEVYYEVNSGLNPVFSGFPEGAKLVLQVESERFITAGKEGLVELSLPNSIKFITED